MTLSRDESFRLFRWYCEKLNHELFYGKYSHRGSVPIGEYGLLALLELDWHSDNDVFLYLELARSLCTSMSALSKPYYTRDLQRVSFIPSRKQVMESAFRALNKQYEEASK
jgi:hypothetical protein